MKRKIIIKITLLFSLLFSLFLSPTSSVVADGPDLNVSGITNPTEANGTYTWAGTYSGYSYWSRTAGSTTYVLYNDIYSTGGGTDRYWNLDTDFEDEDGVLFYSSVSTDPTPTGLNWSADSGTGSLLVESGTPSAEISVLGNGNQISDGSTTISSGNFTNIGSANLSGQTASRTFTINNTGSAELTLSGSSPYVVIGGTNASNFSVTQIPAQTIPSSTGTTTFAITFTPSFEGYHNAVVTINNNDADEGEYTFNIQGYGYVARSLLVSGITDPSAVNGIYLHQGVLNNFQYWKHQTQNYYLYFDVFGGGGYWNIDTDTDDATVYFFKASENGTPVGLSEWSIDTSGDPNPAGSPVVNYAVTSPEIDVQGNGSSISINDTTPSFADHTKFGSINFSSGSRTRTYTILNAGGEALTISGVTLGGSDAAEFSKTDPVLTTIPAYSNTTFSVTFDPSSEGTKTAIVTIASNDSDESSYSFTISGDAFSPKSLIVSDIVDPSGANGTYLYQGILNEFAYWKHESANYYIFNDEYNSVYYWNIDVDTDDTDPDFLFFAASEAISPVGLSTWNHNTTGGYETNGTPAITYAGPEMDVQGNGNSIPDGSSTPSTTNHTDFGSVSAASGSISRTFTIYNTGHESLDLSGNPIVEISGTNAGDFTVTTQPTTPVSALTGTTTFIVKFDPSAGGTRSATVSIANNDSNENPYNFNIQGTGMVAPVITTTAAAGVSTSGATLGGTISNDGGDTVTERGVVYSSSNTTPTIGGANVVQDANGSGSGTFSESISSLSLATHYYYQAYAINSQGTSYGGVEEFTTQNQVSSIIRTSATPTNAGSVSWDVEFSASCSGLSSSNFTLNNTGLTSPAITAVTGSGTSWTVTASTGTGSGTLGLNLTSAAGLNAGLSNISFSGEAYTVDRDLPTVTINQAVGQSDPTSGSPVNFTVVFSKSVTGFTSEDVSISGTAGATTAVVSGSGTTYNVAISGMTGNGTVIAAIATGAAQDAAGNNSSVSTSSDNQVTYDSSQPGVTVSSTASNPTRTSPISVTITFDEVVTGFTPTTASGDLVITNATDRNPAGSGTTYTVDLTPSGQGEIAVSVPANRAQDAAGNWNTVSNSYRITYDSVKPTVTIEQASGQSDPTNASPVHFTVTFSEPVTGFETDDVTLGGTAGATTAAISGSGTTYDVAVSGMTASGTVTASLAADIAQDAALNTSEASTSSDNEVSYIIGPIGVTINQAAGQSDPANTLPVNFTVVFSRAIDLASFTPADLTLSGTAPGTPVITLSEIAPNDGTTFNIAVDGLTAPGTVITSLQANRVQDSAGNNNHASTTTDNEITYDASSPTVNPTGLQSNVPVGSSSLTVKFNEAVYDNPLSDSEADDVTNPANYLLIDKGLNGVTERSTCSAAPPTESDDVYINIDRVIYDSATFTATIEVNGGVSLPLGNYVLFVCGTTSIVDLAGNPINNGLSDFTYNFRVVPASSGGESLPLTGFAPGKSTNLPLQPDSKGYTSTSMVLEIPALGIKGVIVGVPEATGWDVTWLGNQIGYLAGTAFPTWAGNSVLTGHATNAQGGKGPFANLGSLVWGDQVVIHAFGQAYIYEVRTVNRWTKPEDVSVLTKHEDFPWVTLITCSGYDEKADTYRWRTVVRAVQIKVVDED